MNFEPYFTTNPKRKKATKITVGLIRLKRYDLMFY